jgi:hypothetical protein
LGLLISLYLFFIVFILVAEEGNGSIELSVSGGGVPRLMVLILGDRIWTVRGWRSLYVAENKRFAKKQTSRQMTNGKMFPFRVTHYSDIPAINLITKK